MVERDYSLFDHCLLFRRYVMLQKQFLSKSKLGTAKEQPFGGTRFPCPLPTPRATALHYMLTNKRLVKK